jgi:tetratricopeptide (TPR) repeat protein
MAYIYSKLSKKPQAKKFYDLALKYYPHDIDLLIEYALYLETVEIKESLAVYSKIMTLVGKSKEAVVKPELYNNYAVTLIRNKKLDEAIKYLDRAQEENKDQDIVLKYFTLFNKGIYYEEKANFSHAEKIYLDIIRLNPLFQGNFFLF